MAQIQMQENVFFSNSNNLNVNAEKIDLVMQNLDLIWNKISKVPAHMLIRAIEISQDPENFVFTI